MTAVESPRSRTGPPAPPAVAHSSSARPSGRGVAAAEDAVATLALTVLTLAGVYSLSRLFATHAYVGPVLAVVIAMHAVGWACRRLDWRPYASALVSAVALVVMVSWLVLPGSTQFGLPLAGTLQAARQALHGASTDFHSVTAPAPVTHGFLLVTVTAVGILALLADWAAFRMRATLEATVPSFVLFVFCAALGGHRNRDSAVLLEVAALLAFVLIHKATLDQESSAWFASRTRGALGSAASAGAVIALAALFLAINVGFRLPGANSKAVVAWRATDRSGSGTRNTLSPLVDIRGRILDQSTAPVFTVRSAVPSYWRLTSLDSFDGTSWNAYDTYHSVGHRLSCESSPSSSGTRVEQSFTIQQLNEPWLPAAYQPCRIAGIGGVSYDPQSGSLIYSKDTTSGLTYHVSSVVAAPNPVALEAAGPVPAAIKSHYLLRPPASPRVVNLARQIVSGRKTEFDKAIAIQGYLRDTTRFTYSDSYDYQGASPLDHFLFVAHQGYCQQFAGAYAVLARLVNLPTRLAVGWTYGVQTSPGVYQVRDNQAHTWPEVYFAGAGWLAFEPTPGRGNPGAQGYTGVAPKEVGSTGGTNVTTAPATPGTVFPKGKTAPAPKVPKGQHDQSGDSAVSHKSSNALHNVVVVILTLLAGLLALALLAAVMVVVHALRRRLQRDAVLAQAGGLENGDEAVDRWDPWAALRHAWSGEGATTSQRWVRRLRAIVALDWLLPLVPRRSPAPLDEAVVARAEALLSWSEVTALLAWWGVRRHSAETYRELAKRACTELRVPLSLDPEASAALMRLAEGGTRAEFGAGPVGVELVGHMAADLAALRRALLTSAGPRQRLRRLVDPRLAVKVR